MCSSCRDEPFEGSCGNLSHTVTYPCQCCTCRANWTWVNGEDVFLDSYMNWHRSEPTGDRQTVVRLHHAEPRGWKWFDGFSSHSRNYICQRQLAPVTDTSLNPTTTLTTTLVTHITDSTSEFCPCRNNNSGGSSDSANDGEWI